MGSEDIGAITRSIRSAARPLQGRAADYDALMQMIEGHRLVLLGEASHGTHEFYRERARITQRLIEEQQFDAVAVEADWPDALRVDRYAHGVSRDRNAEQALAGFERFPAWMWRNRDVLAFVHWLHRHNGQLRGDQSRVGFYGLDLYSLFSSIDQVLGFLDKTNPQAAERARSRYACFDHCQRDSQRYAYDTAFGEASSCEEAVLAQLQELQALRLQQTREARENEPEIFHAEQNARVVKNAEAYYRMMFRADISSWNLRDRHMADMLEALRLWLRQRNGRPAKIVVWAHNSHVGDARATDMGRHGEWTLGQLARQKYGDETVLVGATTYSGAVTAASDWGAAAERKRVRPALPQSYESLFHEMRIPAFFLPLNTGDSAQTLRDQRLERAIGVIYRPASERHSHYFYSTLPDQFDAVLHFDKTHAVEPLEPTPLWLGGEAPETYPLGI